MRDAPPPLQVAALEGLLAVAAEAPQAFSHRYASRVQWLRSFLDHSDASGNHPQENQASVLSIEMQDSPLL